MQHRTSNIERRTSKWWLIVCLVLFVQTGGRAQQQQPPRKATDAEALAGTAVRAFITPDQLAAAITAGGGGSSPTNGLNLAQILALLNSGTNAMASRALSASNGVALGITTMTNASTVLNNSEGISTSVKTDTSDPTQGPIMTFRGDDSESTDGQSTIAFKEVDDFVNATIEAGHSVTGDSSTAYFQITLANGNFLRLSGTQLTSSNFTGNGASLTNLTFAGAVIAGNNITISRAKVAGTGQTNTTVNVADPLSLSQANVGTGWITNIVVGTNTMGGTAIDFAVMECTTNMAGNITLSSVANLTAGAYNKKLMHCLNTSGSDHTVSIATGWGQGLTDFYTVTNGTRMDLFATCQPGVFTNVFAKIIITH